MSSYPNAYVDISARYHLRQSALIKVNDYTSSETHITRNLVGERNGGALGVRATDDIVKGRTPYGGTT